jgi:hypothetical protein
LVFYEFRERAFHLLTAESDRNRFQFSCAFHHAEDWAIQRTVGTRQSHMMFFAILHVARRRFDGILSFTSPIEALMKRSALRLECVAMAEFLGSGLGFWHFVRFFAMYEIGSSSKMQVPSW